MSWAGRYALNVGRLLYVHRGGKPSREGMCRKNPGRGGHGKHDGGRFTLILFDRRTRYAIPEVQRIGKLVSPAHCDAVDLRGGDRLAFLDSADDHIRDIPSWLEDVACVCQL